MEIILHCYYHILPDISWGVMMGNTIGKAMCGWQWLPHEHMKRVAFSFPQQLCFHVSLIIHFFKINQCWCGDGCFPICMYFKTIQNCLVSFSPGSYPYFVSYDYHKCYKVSGLKQKLLSHGYGDCKSATKVSVRPWSLWSIWERSNFPHLILV
jgi:hypothetical protein